MREPLERLSRVIDYRFNDIDLLDQAMTHRSVGSCNNERQEFLGDAILGFVIADQLYRRIDDANEGQLSRVRASLVKRETLAAIARELDLGTYLHLGPGELRSGGHSRDSILADALEALFCAVYLDGGYQSARELILRLFQRRLERLSDSAEQKDPKTRLQELLQARHLELPRYEIVEVSGQQHQQQFTVRCRCEVLGRETTGRGGSRKKAEQSAAQALLRELENEH